jgi:hypothetical protein
MPWLLCKNWLRNRTPAPAMLSRPTIRIIAILLAFFAAAAAVLGYDFATEHQNIPPVQRPRTLDV